MQPALQPALYESLEALPAGLTGEILNGQLHTQPRPSGPHGRVASRVDRSIGRSYDDGIDGPGGWWIFVEPEVHFVRDVEVTVPDLAGWRRKRMPYLPEDQRFEVVPDWICEILSPSTASRDREVKMPLYAHYKVQYAWLIDPVKRTLEAYRLDAGAWIEIGRFADADQVAVPPFEAMSLDLKGLLGTVATGSRMSTMNISLPDALKAHVDEQVAERGFATGSEYVRELIRRDQDRQRLRTLLLDGAGSDPAVPADKAYFDALRSRVRQGAQG